MPDTYRRIGDESKCPACGRRIDPSAYRCPKCLIYFCYKCRKRVPKGENQFQCANQACSCHGKLLCLACTVMVPVIGDVEEVEEVIETPETKIPGKSGIGCFTMIAVVVIGISVWYYNSFSWGLVAAISALILGAICSNADGMSRAVEPERIEPRKTRKVIHIVKKQVGEHRCCIQCRQPAEIVS